jgi:hypothetical protein
VLVELLPELLFFLHAMKIAVIVIAERMHKKSLCFMSGCFVLDTVRVFFGERHRK